MLPAQSTSVVLQGCLFLVAPILNPEDSTERRGRLAPPKYTVAPVSLEPPLRAGGDHQSMAWSLRLRHGCSHWTLRQLCYLLVLALHWGVPGGAEDVEPTLHLRTGVLGLHSEPQWYESAPTGGCSVGLGPASRLLPYKDLPVPAPFPPIAVLLREGEGLRLFEEARY